MAATVIPHQQQGRMANPIAYSIDGTGTNTIPYQTVQQSPGIDGQQQQLVLQPPASQPAIQPSMQSLSGYQILSQQQASAHQQQQPQQAGPQQAQQSAVVTLPQVQQADFTCPTSCPTAEGETKCTIYSLPIPSLLYSSLTLPTPLILYLSLALPIIHLLPYLSLTLPLLTLPISISLPISYFTHLLLYPSLTHLLLYPSLTHLLLYPSLTHLLLYPSLTLQEVTQVLYSALKPFLLYILYPSLTAGKARPSVL